MFGGVFTAATETQVYSLLEVIANPTMAKGYLDKMVAERKKLEKLQAEMQDRGTELDKQEANVGKREKAAEELRADYQQKIQAMVEREQAVRDGQAQLRTAQAEHNTLVKADRLAHDQREQALTQREYSMTAHARDLAQKLEQADARLAAIAAREAKLKAALE